MVYDGAQILNKNNKGKDGAFCESAKAEMIWTLMGTKKKRREGGTTVSEIRGFSKNIYRRRGLPKDGDERRGTNERWGGVERRDDRGTRHKQTEPYAQFVRHCGSASG